MSDAPVPEYLDPDEIPFTEDEILRTLRLLADSETEAQAIALQVAEGARPVLAMSIRRLPDPEGYFCVIRTAPTNDQ